ncbi:L-alanine-DL-glutamate epimerase-like enolase superfamily enzyme [Filimonas zeae]|uniref:Dipeptide epimerase n=1 Tax=Filimonas zeae TaxID=1737353 RepID=A0A917MVY6_9BACT|nr:dipeptide epimerase [Filimonas zeae]MDR6338581.1 L-alanine-DL-glutamate epimerase-like enolase superfamily enzyme [Filimonas zeae]GGH67558.1 dipeptide epimerase [Filimonas zeae]
MVLHYRTYDLPFEYPFTISNGRTKTHQPTLIVALQLGPFWGFGEAPAISYYNITVAQMVADLEAKKRMVEKFALTEPERYWHYLHHLYPQNPFLVCALDMAGWDLFGKMKGKPLYELWNTSFTDNTPVTDYTIGIDTIDTMVAKMKAKPWPVYKIKLGTPDDIGIIEALREHTDAVFRVDANAAWTLEEALEKIPQLKALGVELIEQPLARDNWEGMKVLYQQSPLPLFADESCVLEGDVVKCKDHFHGINIKLTKCSGITPAIRMIRQARELGLKVMMGSMNESSIGSAAIAAFLPQLDYADLDGPLLLKEDKATGIVYNNGRVELSGKPGLGITPAL